MTQSTRNPQPSPVVARIYQIELDSQLNEISAGVNRVLSMPRNQMTAITRDSGDHGDPRG